MTYSLISSPVAVRVGASLAGLVALALLLGGCGDGDATSAPTPAADAGGDASGADGSVTPPGDLGGTTGGDTDTPQDGGPPPPPDGGPLEPCDPAGSGLQRTVVLPLGETLFLNGDDYLAFWGVDHACEVELTATPAGAEAALVGAGPRLTPDLVGEWTLRRGPDSVTVQVADDTLGPDTFLNYNYTPVTPIAVVDDTTLLVVAPTSNAVHRVTIGADDAVAEELIPTGGWPTSVVVVASGEYALVAQTSRDSLGFLDLDRLQVTDAIRVGDEPAGIVLDDAAGVAYVTISGADAVVKVDLAARAVIGRVDVGRDPRAMALSSDGQRLFVASLMSSNEHRFGLLEGETEPEWQRDVAVVDTASFEVVDWIPEVGTLLRGLWLSPDDKRLLVAVTHSNNDKASIDADSKPHNHGLAVVDVDPASATQWSVLPVDLDAQPTSSGPAASPFSMIPTPDGAQLLVTLSAGKAVLALDPETFEEVVRLPVGNDPRGLVFAQGRAWTTSWLDNQLQGFEWPLTPTTEDSLVSVEIGLDPTPMAIKQGQRVFNDAAFSEHGDFSCNNCHIDGLTDGLVWDLLVDGNVNTLAFRNVAGTDPFLWGGQLPTLFDFSREVLKLVGAEASGEQMERLTLYMQSVVLPPNPYSLPGGRLSEQALVGQALFEGGLATGGAGCTACHSGPLYTNKTTVKGKTAGMMTDVPALIGVYDTAPFGRQGQWRTLEDMVEYAVEFTGAPLDPAQRAALLKYVQEIPGDSLYLNSARPLSGSDHVWHQSPIELVFSQVLSPGQEDHFAFHQLAAEPGAGEPTAVEGTWTLSGRVARFEPAADLSLETHYGMTVSPGLLAALGQELKAAIDVGFRTGGVPELDVSGKWTATLIATEPIAGSIDATIALLQESGGNIAGVLVSSFDEAEVDHVEGVVSGKTLVLEPFLFDSSFGQILVDGGTVEMVDVEGDGWADSGAGTITALGYVAQLLLVRQSYPEDAGIVP